MCGLCTILEIFHFCARRRTQVHTGAHKCENLKELCGFVRLRLAEDLTTEAHGARASDPPSLPKLLPSRNASARQVGAINWMNPPSAGFGVTCQVIGKE
jgi:hypothetical protein